MQRLLHPLSRLLLVLATGAMSAGFWFPLWQIQLWAPQYPEGLNMKIWLSRLSGAFDIINGLNHYIGMAMIRQEMFPEFGFMPYVLGGLIAIGMIAAIRGTRRALWIYASILGGCGLAGLVDFYRWGYQYGHNLDPHAAIQVPGMSYQPPLLGYKNLLNFTAYSGPDIGGWTLIGAGAVVGLLLAWEQFFRRGADAASPLPTAPAAMSSAVCALTATVLIPSCSPAPEPMKYGQDTCAECSMTITDQRFGAEVVTVKGKVFKFDDIGCLQDFLKKDSVPDKQRRHVLVSDFQKANAFIPAHEAVYLASEKLKTPMRGDRAAFRTLSALEAVKNELGEGSQVQWPDLEDNK